MNNMTMKLFDPPIEKHLSSVTLSRATRCGCSQLGSKTANMSSPVKNVFTVVEDDSFYLQ